MSSAHQKRTGGGSNRCAYESTPIHGNPPSLCASALAPRLGGELRQAGHVTAGPGETRRIREHDGRPNVLAVLRLMISSISVRWFFRGVARCWLTAEERKTQ